MDDTKEPPARQGVDTGTGTMREATLLRPCPGHMSATERLRKVIQELVDTEKSYVKVSRRRCVTAVVILEFLLTTFVMKSEASCFWILVDCLEFLVIWHRRPPGIKICLTRHTIGKNKS